MLSKFLIEYKFARWGCLTIPGFIPQKNLGTRNNILVASWLALKATAKQLHFNLFKRKKRMQEEENFWMTAELPPRLVPGRRMITDSVKVEGDADGNTV